MNYEFANRVAMVTGAGQGIGKAVAVRLSREGARTAAVDINAATAESTAAEIRNQGGDARSYSLDLARAAEIRPAVDRIAGDFGRIDILVNAAGVLQAKPFLEVTEQDWDRIVDVNQKALLFCIQAVAAHMIRAVPEDVRRSGRASRSHGKIVNFSSISGRHGRPLQVHYAASKAAVISITQSAALAFAPFNINVNAVCPGVVPTPMWEKNDREVAEILGLPPGQAMRDFIERIPLKRAATLKDVAAAVAFLCSEDADYITGQTLNVDGGFEMN
jgi:NAD(P)-dependent dehydrogenase (short-subunit alcohol dehydrogenase family)